jgi:hypothetical protein
VELKIKINSTKGPKINKKNKGQIEKKYYIANWNRRKKLKTNKTFTKQPRKKFRNQKKKY